MEVVIAPRVGLAGNFAALDADRPSSSVYFASVINGDSRLTGKVLDVGCGKSGPTVPAYATTLRRAAQIDGIDPFPEVKDNPMLTRRWVGGLEDVPDVPSNEYDAVVSFFVAEHVANPAAFLAAVHRVLKPGGVFYACTPHSQHPFAWCVRLVETLNLKGKMEDLAQRGWNRYPAYYRLNSRRAVLRAARGLDFARAEFHYHPCVQWDENFPRVLRWAPRLFDRLIGVHVTAMAQQMMFKLEKA